MNKNVVRASLVAGAGFSLGTVAYSYATSTPHQVDWFRVVFTGVFMVIGSWLWNSYRARRTSKPPA